MVRAAGRDPGAGDARAGAGAHAASRFLAWKPEPGALPRGRLHADEPDPVQPPGRRRLRLPGRHRAGPRRKKSPGRLAHDDGVPKLACPRGGAARQGRGRAQAGGGGTVARPAGRKRKRCQGLETGVWIAFRHRRGSHGNPCHTRIFALFVGGNNFLKIDSRTLDKDSAIDSNDGDSASAAARPDRVRMGKFQRGRLGMTPALASASPSTDSIKGLAQSIAKPAYRRLLVAEPALRRAVPVLIIAFLLTMAFGTGVQVHDRRHQAIATVVAELDATADQLAARLDQAVTTSKNDVLRGTQDLLDRLLPSRARDGGREIFVSDIDGNIVAAAPFRMPGRPLLDILGPDQPLTTFGATAGVLETPLADGTPAFATVRLLKAPLGQVAIIQSRAQALAPWRSDTVLTVTLSATTGFVVLILGFAFHWQATRAREADAIYDTVRARIDTALNRGRCGLWDWDLARGRIFWSHSMFAILGLEPRADLLTFGEVAALVNPQDLKLYDLAAQLADGKTMSIDRAFRMRHARGDWVWLRARCEIIRQRDGADPHLIGIAVDITEQKDLMEKTIAADLRLRDAIETIPEAFVLWDAENRLVLCNSNFQALHNLPDEAVTAGTCYEDIVAAGRKPQVRSQSANEHAAGEIASDPGARTFEAQLDDGRWLHISERRTKDGGYVSVGTDITAIKRHESRL